MINKDLNDLNRKIVNIYRSGMNLIIKRFDGSRTVETIEEVIPDMNEEDEQSASYVENKPKIYNVLYSPYEVDYPYDMDIAVLKDESRFIYSDQMKKWVKIDRSLEDKSTRIDIPYYIKDKKYAIGEVVAIADQLFMATKDTAVYPLAYGSPWLRMTHLDMFVNRCGMEPPRLYGQLVVSEIEPWIEHEIEITNREEFYYYFNQNDRDGDFDIVDTTGGFCLVAKDDSVEEMNFFKLFEPGSKIFRSVEISGTTDSDDSIGSIDIECNGSFLVSVTDNIIEYDDVLLETLSYDADGYAIRTFDIVNGSGEEFSVGIETVGTETTCDKINVRFKYSNDYDLSRHVIKSIKLKYLEKEE